MTYKDLFYEQIEGGKRLLEKFKCCFVSQMNHNCIAITKDSILKNEKTIFADGFFNINNQNLQPIFRPYAIAWLSLNSAT